MTRNKKSLSANADGPGSSSRSSLTGECDIIPAALPDFSGLPIHESGFPIIEFDIDPAEVMVLQREMIDQMCKAIVDAGKMCAKARQMCEQTGHARRLATTRRCGPRSR